VDNLRVRYEEAALDAAFSISVDSTVIRSAVSVMAVDSQLSAQVIAGRTASATLTSNFTLTANALDLDLAAANISATTALSVSARRFRGTNASLTAFATQLTVAREVPGEETLDFNLRVSYPGAQTSTFGITDVTNVNTSSATGTLENVWANLLVNLQQNPNVNNNNAFGNNSNVLQLFRYGASSVILHASRSGIEDPLGFGYQTNEINYDPNLSPYWIVISTTVAVKIDIGFGWTSYTSNIMWYKQLDNNFDFTNKFNLHYQIVPRVVQTGNSSSNVTISTVSPRLNGSTSGWFVKQIPIGSAGSAIDLSGNFSYAPPFLVAENDLDGYFRYNQNKFGGDVRLEYARNPPTTLSPTAKIDLSHLWVKSTTDVPASEFWISGAPKVLSSNGTTGFSYVPDVYIDARSRTALDQNTNSPTWNYTGAIQAVTSPAKEFYADFNSSTTLSCQNQIVKLASSSMQAVSQSTVSANRLRSTPVAVTSTANLTVAATTAATAQAQLVSTSTVQANANRLRSTPAAVSVTADLVANNVRSRNFDLAVNSTTELTADSARIRFDQIALETTTALAAQAIAIKSAVIATESIASTLDAVTKIGDFLVGLDVIVTMTVDGIIEVNPIIDLASEFLQTTNATTLVVAESSQSVETALFVESLRVRPGEITANSLSDLSVEAIKVVEATATLTTTSSVTANVDRSRDIILSLTANSTVTALSARTRPAASAMSSVVYDFTCSPTFIVRIEATFTAFNAQLTAGRVIHLDPLLTWRIEPESRYLKINDETRVYTIEEETRIIKIKGYVL
jgi:hypothetical protein